MFCHRTLNGRLWNSYTLRRGLTLAVQWTPLSWLSLSSWPALSWLVTGRCWPTAGTRGAMATSSAACCVDAWRMELCMLTITRLNCSMNWLHRWTLWCPLLPYGYSYKASCAILGYAIICNFWHPGALTISLECQSARMSKITHDSSTQSGTGCFIAVPIWQLWVSKG